MKIIFISLMLLSPLASAQNKSSISETIQKAIQTNPVCKKVGNFYWEIGDSKTLLASGSVGTQYNRSTKMPIASASKWLFGAYAFERTDGKISEEQKKMLQMTSGYTSMRNLLCFAPRIRTVNDCFEASNWGLVKKKVSNNTKTPEHVGKFFYNGGHAQAFAVDLGLGAKTGAQLGEEISYKLSLPPDLTYKAPQLAGGGITNTEFYAAFLQNILSGKYKLSAAMPLESGVCANKFCNQGDVLESPTNDYPFRYGYHYWIEQNSKGETQAYNSLGLFGYYPWITPDMKFYGILARKEEHSGAYNESYECGKIIRETFLANSKPAAKN